MDKHLKHRLNAGRVAVKEQVEFFRRQLGRVSSEWKEDDTRVTFADFAISERITAELRRSFPNDDYCSEEANPQDEVLPLRAKFAWMLDPIDGTNNYALGIPICGISLALLREGTPVYGFIYDMSRDRMIEGGPGLGLLDGGQNALKKPRDFGSQSIIGLSFPLKAPWATRLLPLLQDYRVRSMGSGALNLSYTALGLIDGCIDFRVKAWDIAAAHAFVMAAGGEFHFLNKPGLFPMEAFHVSQAPSPYYAGSPAFCKAAREWLETDQ